MPMLGWRHVVGLSIVVAACGGDDGVGGDIDAAEVIDGTPVDAVPIDADPMVVQLRTGLLAAWPLDGNGEDLGDGGLDLTVPQGTTFVQGAFGQALGTGSMVARAGVDEQLSLATGDFTVRVMARPTTMGSGYIVTRGRNWFVGTFALEWIAGERGVMVSGGSYTLNAFHHVVFTREAGTLRLIVDGVVVRTATADQTATDPAEPLRLGHFPNGAAFVGDIDDVGVWSRALTADERAYLATHPIP